MKYPKLVADALKILNKGYTSNQKLRDEAIKKLEKVPTHILKIYLLQLVQALRHDFDITQFTIPNIVSNSKENSFEEWSDISIGPLGTFLIEKSLKDEVFASFFHWYVRTEIHTHNTNHFFNMVYEKFLEKLDASDNGRQIVRSICLQSSFISQILSILRSLSDVNRLEKTQKLRKYLIDVSIPEPIPLPLDPRKMILSINKTTARIFPSANGPAIIDLRVEDEKKSRSNFRMMFKSEDLRQDQLCISMIRMINKLLISEGLDMYLTSYTIISTSSEDGFVEFVPNSWSITKIIREYGDLDNFFRNILVENNDPGSDHLDRFIKSCAGFTMIMYILGVGDRHSDNIMIKPTGEMFHIDFGYMFGRDPKPIKQDFSVTRELVLGMGGRKSIGYHKFRNYCWKIFKIMRENYFLITNMLSLMTEADIPDFSVLQDSKTVMNNIKSRFQLKFNDDDAEVWLYNNINRNADALGPVFMDYLHRRFSISE